MTPPHILVLDDNPQIQKLFARVLDGLALVTTVATVRDALSEPGPFDLVFLDRMVPNGDGWKLQEHFAGTPTVLMSGSGVESPEFAKPFGPTAIREKVAEKLGQ